MFENLLCIFNYLTCMFIIGTFKFIFDISNMFGKRLEENHTKPHWATKQDPVIKSKNKKGNNIISF